MVGVGARGGGRTKADGVNVGRHVVHRVEDSHARRDGAARAVDVERDVLLRVLVGQVQQLRHEHVANLVVHLRAQQQNACRHESS